MQAAIVDMKSGQEKFLNKIMFFFGASGRVETSFCIDVDTRVAVQGWNTEALL